MQPPSRPPRLAAWIVIAAAIAGCTALPQPTAPTAGVAIPDGWSNADAAGAGALAVNEASLAAWWQRFDDAQLDRLVTAALQANTRVVSAQAALRQAQALRDVAAAALWPSLGGSASVRRGLAEGRSTGNTVQAGLEANWAPDVFGATRAGVDAGTAEVDASEATLGDLQVQVAAETALDYILLRSTQARAAIAAENLASQEETLQITLWRQQAGLVTALEAEQARAAVAQNRAVLPALQTSIVQTQHALAVLTGQPPAALAWLAFAPLAAPVVPLASGEPVLAIPAQTLRQRADVRAAERRVAAALAQVGQARAQRWPSFSIGGTLGLTGATVSALGDGGAALGSVLASVALPLIDGGARRAQVRVQQAALDQAQQLYRAAVLTALKDVEDALAALRGNRARLASLRLAADAAAQASLLARQRYASGLVDFQTVLETQRTQYATRDGVLTASADVGSDHVRLFTALGGGWPTDAPTPTP